VMYSSPDIAGLFVPTGEDQVSHVETSREIARRFNAFYGLEISVDVLLRMPNREFEQLMKQIPNLAGAHGWKDVLADKLSNPPAEARVRQNLNLIIRHEVVASGFQNFIETRPGFVPFVRQTDKLNPPESMLTKTPRIPGLDGRKMSKSYGNTITLSETDEEIRKKTKVMVTDPARKRRSDPGNPDVCPVYDWHKLFSTRDTLDWAAHGCRTAGIGCIECKAKMADHLIEWIAPVRERRVKYEKNPKQVLELLDAGSKKAREVAQGTMRRVREAVLGWEKKRGEIGGTAAKV
jgi:tryptophanyl-tRNA synthetase